ncbi:MAG: epimerase [Litoreibacter sp.]
MTKTVLILGSSGRFGRTARAAFSYAGWDVQLFDRSKDVLEDAAWGADLIVNSWNPPYADWAREVPALTAQIIEVARNTGATVLIPGNVYPYGTHMPALINADTPFVPSTPLGKIRYEMEQAYNAAGVRTIVLRAGDFIDTAASGNWYDKIITAKIAQGRIIYPGATDIPHSWAYLPDLADAAVALSTLDLPTFTTVNFPGYTLSGVQLHRALEAITGRQLKLKQMGWLPLQIATPFWPMARNLLEMRYLWDTPHALINDKFGELLPDFCPTPLYEALASSIPVDIDPDRLVARDTVSLSLTNGPVDA